MAQDHAPKSDPERAVLAPKAQQAIGKAFEVLKDNLTADGAADARKQLQTAHRLAPASAEVYYLFGIYSLQIYDRSQAKSSWTKALELDPRHYRTLLSLSQALLDENKPGEALPYLERAVDLEPFGWRAYALFSDAYLLQGNFDQAEKQAERALEVGHGEAAVVQRYQAAALAKLGERDKAISILQSYVGDHHADAAARKQLEKLQLAGQNAKDAADASVEDLLQPGALTLVTAHPLPINWLPPDIDKEIPPVEAGSSCALDEVVKKAGQRIEELVVNVDRFAATESLQHDPVHDWGLDLFPQKQKFDYLVSIHERKPGVFEVQEYRTNKNPANQFPGGIASNGLPAMALIFHPHQTDNFVFTCEGLSQTKSGAAWQVHFRQRADRPNTMRSYRNGMGGQAYRVDMKGRAWISAESYQILRMETQMIAPIPEIRLAADYTAIEYGPVHFQSKNLDMWLPQTAEVYSDWQGRRFQRRHSFSNYLLFSVDDKEKIMLPKSAEETAPTPGGEAPKP